MKMEYISAEPGLRRGSTVYHIQDGYYFNLVGSDSTRSYLICNRKTCSVRASMPLTQEDRTVESLRVRGEHNHVPDLNRIQVTKLKRGIIKRCLELGDVTDFRRIYHEECAKFDSDVCKRIGYRSMYLMTNRARQRFTKELNEEVDDHAERYQPPPLKVRKRPVINPCKGQKRVKRGAKFKGRILREQEVKVSSPYPHVEEVMDDDNVVVFYVSKNSPGALNDQLSVVHQEDIEVESSIFQSHHEEDNLLDGSREVELEGVQPAASQATPATAEVKQAIIAAAAEAAKAATAKIVEAITAASAEAIQAAVAEFSQTTRAATAKVTQAVTAAATEATKTAVTEIAQIITAAAAEATKSAAGEVERVIKTKATQGTPANAKQSVSAEFALKAAAKVAQAITASATEATKVAAAEVAQAITSAAVKAI